MKLGCEIKFWTDQDDATLTEMWLKETRCCEIAELLGRKRADISARRCILKLPSIHQLRTARMTNPKFMKEFQDLYNAGASFAEMRDRMKLQQHMVYKMMSLLGLPRRRPGSQVRRVKRIGKKTYSDQTIAEISQKVDEGLDIQTIADHMGLKYDAVNSILSRYRLRRSGRQPWTPEADEIMISLLKEGMSIKELSIKIKRTALSIGSRCSKLGLSGKFPQIINIGDKNRKEDVSIRLSLKYRLNGIFGRHNHACDISLEFLLEMFEKQGGKCYYSGYPMNTKRGSPYVVSIDRKDSSRGYHADNVVLACWRVNKMKQDFSVEDFIETCKAISSTAQCQQAQQELASAHLPQ